MDEQETTKNNFMAEVEKDANRRAAERKERDTIAQNLRKSVVMNMSD